MPLNNKAALEAQIAELRAKLEQMKPQGATATLDPLTVFLEDLLDFLLELVAAII
jgi:hypothetical protein